MLLVRVAGICDMLYGLPRDSTAAFDMGTVHASALPGENADEMVRMPAGMKKTTKEGKAFVVEHKGRSSSTLRCLRC